MNNQQATENLDNLKRSVAAKCHDFNIAHLTLAGFFMTERGLESFLYKIIHPYYENSAACELGEVVFADVLEIVKELPGAIRQPASNEIVTVIPGAPMQTLSPDAMRELFRLRENLNDIVTDDGVKLEMQCKAVEQQNGVQFMQDFCNCEEVVCALTWSMYFMTVTKYSIWFAAQHNKVPYEMLPPKSQHNGSDKLRMWVKYI
jgi:hypothetical protein